MELNFKDKVSEFLYEDPEVQVFISIMEKVFTDISDMMDNFPELAQVDNVSELFLPKLSELIKYNYRYDFNVDAQREVIKRLLEVYRTRGTDDSIIMAATYGHLKEWIGAHLFIPGYDPQLQKATVEYAYSRVFRHNKSKHSSGDKFADGMYYSDGILIINTNTLTDESRLAIQRVVPAGIKILFNNSSEMEGSNPDGTIDFRECSISDDQLIDYQAVIKDSRTDLIVFSAPVRGRKLRSGRRLVEEFYSLEIEKDVPNLINENDFLIEVREILSGLPLRSTFSAKRSGRYAMSGSKHGRVELDANYNGINPNDAVYNVESVGDKVARDSNPDNSAEVTVEILTSDVTI